MKSISKKLLLILLLNLNITIVFSQEIISKNLLTKESGELDTLKIVNIIFSEHEKFLNENVLLKNKITSLEKLNSIYESKDSLRNTEINLYKEELISKNEKISKLKSSQKKILGGSLVGGIVLFLIGLIL